MAFRIRVVVFSILIVLLFVSEISGHGLLLDPPNRSSIWRVYPDEGLPSNYNDAENFCGGLSHIKENGLKCGVCGDPYESPHPQDNENTGKYGQGKIGGTYQSGSTVNVTIDFWTNHMGYYTFSLCVLDDPNAPETGEECFRPIQYADGSDEYYIQITDPVITLSNLITLPSGVTCDRCTLRWHYVAGNNWGDCGNGTSAMGCGPQETFRSCSDITIV